eukprot:7175019-Pyramimonas_sp.AAC.1
MHIRRTYGENALTIRSLQCKCGVQVTDTVLVTVTNTVLVTVTVRSGGGWGKFRDGWGRHEMDGLRDAVTVTRGKSAGNRCPERLRCDGRGSRTRPYALTSLDNHNPHRAHRCCVVLIGTAVRVSRENMV